MVAQGSERCTEFKKTQVFLIEGDLGRGKTRTAWEACTRAASIVPTHTGALCGYTYTSMHQAEWEPVVDVEEADVVHFGERLLAYVLAWHARSGIQRFATFHSPDTLDAVVSKLIETGETRRYLILDDIHMAPRAVSCLLRAIAAWNSSSSPSRGARIAFIPVCVGRCLSSVDFKRFADTAGLALRRFSVPLLIGQSDQLLKSVLVSLNKKDVDRTHFRVLAESFDGWPLAFAQLHSCLRFPTSEITNAKFGSVESCRAVFSGVCYSLTIILC